MQNLPKIKDLKSPDGYFDSLPDQILAKSQKRESYPWIKWAASITLIVSIGVWQWNNYDSTSEALLMEEEIDLYIDSQYWSAEDILSMSENPEEILNEIIEDENPFIEEGSSDQEEIWY